MVPHVALESKQAFVEANCPLDSRHYEYEQFIQELLNANKQQATLHTFLNKFCCFLYMSKVVTIN